MKRTRYTVEIDDDRKWPVSARDNAELIEELITDRRPDCAIRVTIEADTAVSA